MKTINTLSFGQLNNAEHVAFFHNVYVAIEKVGISKVGITADQISQFKLAVDAEQDIVNRSTGSVYTPEMKHYDDERDRLFRLIRLKMQAICLASPDAPVAKYATEIDKYLLTKYGNDITTAAYQAESALIRGFLLDVNTRFAEDDLEELGLTIDIAELQQANDRFTEMYNERVTEKSATSTELTKQLRSATEQNFALLSVVMEFKANTDLTEAGTMSGELIAVINELIKDAKRVLNLRLGKEEDPLPNPEPDPLPNPLPLDREGE